MSAVSSLARVTRTFALLIAAVVTVLLIAGPTSAVENQQPATTTDTSGSPRGEESGRMKLPLDLEDPQDLVGLGILIVTGIGAALAGANMFKQLRGERPQATGRWRPR
ncbi:MAG: hypothetical protein ABR592_08695 [Nitriliruptorales bacterium]